MDSGETMRYKQYDGKKELCSNGSILMKAIDSKSRSEFQSVLLLSIYK